MTALYAWMNHINRKMENKMSEMLHTIPNIHENRFSFLIDVVSHAHEDIHFDYATCGCPYLAE